MINILSYVGMNMQSEVCLWCLLGLVRTIFDATLFKVNANLKQVWQMTMPEELTMPVQRVLRTMMSGIMLVQCFTVYVYLASYIVLLYPVFLEERPTLVLPWLLLAAIRKLLCELTSLALGLGTCVLLGPARPPCIKFVVVKFTSIMPAFYMWMLVFSYYHALKVASAFKTFPAVLPPNDNDYGLELAVRRRRTKSLLGEEQLRKKLVAHYYGDRSSSISNETYLRPVMELSSRIENSPDTNLEEVGPETDANKPLTVSTTGWSEIGAYEDWFGSEVMIPRDTDRILEQIVLMLLRIGAFLKKEGIESIIDSQILNSAVPASWPERDNIDCAAMNADDTDTPPLVGSSKGNMASYLREYPQIFMKKQNPDIPQTECTLASLKTVHSHVESEEGNTSKSRIKHVTPDTSTENIPLEVENIAYKKKISISDNTTTQEDTNDEQTLPRQIKSKPTAKMEGNKLKSKLKKHRDSEYHSKDNENANKVNNYLQDSTIPSEDNNKEYLYEILNEETKNELTDGKISNENKTNGNKLHKEKDIVRRILDEDANENVATYSKISDEAKLHNNIKILNEKQNGYLTSSSSKNGELANSIILKEDNNKIHNHIEISDENQDETLTCSSISSEDSDKELTHSDMSNVFKSKNKKAKNSNAPKMNDDLMDRERLNKEFIHTQILMDAMKNGISSPNKISEEDNNVEYSNLDDTMQQPNSKETLKLNEPPHSKTLIEANNKEFTYSQTSNIPNSKDPTNNNILNPLNEDGDEANEILGQNSKQTVNSEMKQPSDVSSSKQKRD